MIYVTTEYIAGKEIIEYLGIPIGRAIRAGNIGRDIFASLMIIIDVEISEYTKLLVEARERGIKRMLDDAEHLGADAIVNVRCNSSQVMQGEAERLAYGTAERLK